MPITSQNWIRCGTWAAGLPVHFHQEQTRQLAQHDSWPEQYLSTSAPPAPSPPRWGRDVWAPWRWPGTTPHWTGWQFCRQMRHDRHASCPGGTTQSPGSGGAAPSWTAPGRNSKGEWCNYMWTFIYKQRYWKGRATTVPNDQFFDLVMTLTSKWPGFRSNQIVYVFIVHHTASKLPDALLGVVQILLLMKFKLSFSFFFLLISPLSTV